MSTNADYLNMLFCCLRLGDVKTYQDGQLGLLVKVVPKYDSIKKIHTIGCWKKFKKHRGKIRAQNILPTKWFWPFKATLDEFEVCALKLLLSKPRSGIKIVMSFTVTYARVVSLMAVTPFKISTLLSYYIYT